MSMHYSLFLVTSFGSIDPGTPKGVDGLEASITWLPDFLHIFQYLRQSHFRHFDQCFPFNIDSIH
jgi:hypothetical protein